MLEHIKLKMEQNQPIRYGHKYNSQGWIQDFT